MKKELDTFDATQTMQMELDTIDATNNYADASWFHLRVCKYNVV